MDELATRAKGAAESLPTLRDLLMPIFRRRRLVMFVFWGIFIGGVLGGLLLPRRYEAEMKIFVNRGRVDAVVTPDAEGASALTRAPDVSEEEINSEVELLKSRDLLEQVAVACRLEPTSESGWKRFASRMGGIAYIAQWGKPDRATQLAQAVEELQEKLVVDPLKKTTLIRVTYPSSNPQLAAKVLRTLATLYQEKHAAVQRPAGTFAFFDQQTSRYRDELAEAESQLADFDDREKIVEPIQQKQLLLQQLSQFEAELETDQASARGAAERAQSLRMLSAAMPARQTTQMRKTDNAQLLADLESTLLSLELKRSDMLIKYAPTYPPVADVEAQIASTRAAIARARQSPTEEVTTDRLPVQDWMTTELAKAQADQDELQAEATSMGRTVHEYEQAAEQLNRESMTRDDFVRNVKAAEENYLLYLHKREEARISDALDSRRILNVSIAEAATVPALPTRSMGWVLVAGFFAATTASMGAAYVGDRIDPSFCTPTELGRYLDVKVLASIPSGVARS